MYIPVGEHVFVSLPTTPRATNVTLVCEASPHTNPCAIRAMMSNWSLCDRGRDGLAENRNEAELNESMRGDADLNRLWVPTT